MNITNPSPAHSEIDIDEDIKQVTGGWRWHLLGTIDHEWSGRSHTQLFRSIVFQLVRVDRPSKCSVFHFRIVRLFVEILSSSAADVYEHGSNRTELPYAHTMAEQVCEKAFALVQERCGRLSTPRAFKYKYLLDHDSVCRSQASKPLSTQKIRVEITYNPHAESVKGIQLEDLFWPALLRCYPHSGRDRLARVKSQLSPS